MQEVEVEEDQWTCVKDLEVQSQCNRERVPGSRALAISLMDKL